MAKAKAKKVPSTFTATTRKTWGKGKKAVSVEIAVTVDFEDFRPWSSDPKGLKRELEDEAFNTVEQMEGTSKVLNMKQLFAAYKAFKKAQES